MKYNYTSINSHPVLFLAIVVAVQASQVGLGRAVIAEQTIPVIDLPLATLGVAEIAAGIVEVTHTANSDAILTTGIYKFLAPIARVRHDPVSVLSIALSSSSVPLTATSNASAPVSINISTRLEVTGVQFLVGPLVLYLDAEQNRSQISSNLY